MQVAWSWEQMMEARHRLVLTCSLRYSRAYGAGGDSDYDVGFCFGISKNRYQNRVDIILNYQRIEKIDHWWKMRNHHSTICDTNMNYNMISIVTASTFPTQWVKNAGIYSNKTTDWLSSTVSQIFEVGSTENQRLTFFTILLDINYFWEVIYNEPVYL